MMKDFLINFFTSTPWWELLIIFIAKVIEVSIGTLRVILINKGYRKQGVILSFIENIIWVFVASKVIVGISAKPIKGIIYSLGYAAGVYVGSLLENRLAFGKVVIQVITSKEMGSILTEKLRSEGIGVTKMQGEGKDEKKDVLLMYVNRKGHLLVVNQIEKIDSAAVVTTTDLSLMKGGYLSTLKKFAK